MGGGLAHYSANASAEPMGATPTPVGNPVAKELLEARRAATPAGKQLAWHPTAAAVTHLHQGRHRRQPGHFCQEYQSVLVPLKGQGIHSVSTGTGQVHSGQTFAYSSLLVTAVLK